MMPFICSCPACYCNTILTHVDRAAQAVELSSIVSETGARSQPAHCDTEAEQGDGRLLTAFVALDDVVASMGPTLVWPGTHLTSFHQELAARGPAALHARCGYRLDLRKGDVALLDSRLWHCGGPNTSGRQRCLLVASFGPPAGSPLPSGSTYSLLPHLVGKHTLRTLRAHT